VAYFSIMLNWEKRGRQVKGKCITIFRTIWSEGFGSGLCKYGHGSLLITVKIRFGPHHGSLMEIQDKRHAISNINSLVAHTQVQSLSRKTTPDTKSPDKSNKLLSATPRTIRPYHSAIPHFIQVSDTRNLYTRSRIESGMRSPSYLGE
jgi:hypothetical protein